MNKTFICTREVPLRMQLDEDECLKISEIHLEGFLNGEDMLALSQMSKNGSLKRLDMSGVTELDVEGLAGMDDGYCTGNHIPFYYNNKIEEVIFPSVDGINAQMFTGCKNLRKVVIPKTLKWLGEEILSSCPNIEEIYVPSNLGLQTYQGFMDYRFPSFSFMGSGMKFVSDNDGWPEEMKDGEFFAYDGVLYHYNGMTDEIELYRYPAGDKRIDFTIPDGVTTICKYAFYKNPFLRKVTIPPSVHSYDEIPFEDCSALEIIVFKEETIYMYSTQEGSYIGGVGLQNIPNLKHIYLYAKNPKNICFDMFNGCKNIGKMTLHVPCSCKKIYEDYEVKWNDGRVEKAYRRFHHIEEFQNE